MIFASADATPRYCALVLAPNCALLSTLLPVATALQQQAMKKRDRERDRESYEVSGKMYSAF